MRQMLTRSSSSSLDRMSRSSSDSLTLSDSCRLALMGVVFAFVLSLALSPNRADAQQMRYMSGQNVVPVYEGWERNTDGSFTMVFGAY
ncbi:MAG: hypothetical protein U0Q11_18440 [Vicinamibacterales bacterium]